MATCCSEVTLTKFVCRPMGYVAGLINKGGQTAGEIVREIVDEAYEVLSKAKTYAEPAKL